MFLKMKTKISKKLIVSTLSTAMGVSLVGAITGTVAWYQYSTRSTVSFVGTTIRNSENLQVSFDKDDVDSFVNDLSQTDIAGQVVNTQLLPITTGAQAKNANLKLDDNSKPIFYANPIYQKFGYNEWLRADASAYVQFTVYLKLNKVVNNDPAVIIEAPRKVYLGDFLIQDDRQNDLADISDAIRVHLHSDHEDMLLGKTNDNTNVFGALDLNLDNRNDTEEVIYSFTDMNNVTEGVYGEVNKVQEKYEFDDVKPTGTDSEGLLTGDHYLGTLFSKEVIFTQQAAQFEANVDYYEEDTLENITADQAPVLNKKYYVRQDALPVTVTIWLEGWHKLEDIKKVQLPAGYNLDGLEYFEDAGLQNRVVAGTEAGENATFYVDDGEGHGVAVHPIQGQKLNDGVVYYTDVKLNNQASGDVVDATADYYYSNGQSAMWDALRYVGAKFDVGLMFEVDA